MEMEKEMSYIFETENLCKYYGKFKAVDGLNMSIPKGSIYGFVGKNGAGKTTLMRMLCGLQKPTSGSYKLFDTKFDDKNINQKRKKMGAVVETPAIFGDLSARDNLKLQCMNVGISDKNKIDEVLSLVGLTDVGRKKAKKFSLGMRQRLGIAMSLIVEPEFLILDEPINGLDPQGISEIRELIYKLNKERGITILISSHILDELAKLATYYGFIDNGRIIKEMSATELEKSCRKNIRMKVESTKILSEIMKKRNIEYKIIDDHVADVFSDLKFSEIADDFIKAGCDIISMEEHEESLEAFFLSLVGGQNDD